MSCTCGGSSPDYPWHEWFCGIPERDDDCTCGDCSLDPNCIEHGHLADVPAEVA